MKTDKIIQHLLKSKKTFSSTTLFSSLPGIYAFFYYGLAFPLKSAGHIKKGDLIYIGKTESSQISRDQKTHFTSGKTGSSTVRRSLGAILKDELNLKPIPRNATDFTRGRYHHYKFDNESEEKLTNWMVDNLGLSFYEYPASKAELEQLESALINKLCPILNLSKNSANRFGAEISALRKRCAEEARGVKVTEIKPYKDQKTKTSSTMMSKYGSQSNPENKYKLHEAMELVIKNCPNRTATADFISEEIWKKGLYKKNDGGRALPGQIKLRAKNYSQFDLTENLIKLI